MDEAQFALLSDQMIAEVAAHAALAGEMTGRQAIGAPVLAAMAAIPRHEFVPLEVRPYAYVNAPLPIGFGKTISQPFIAALMTDLLDPRPEDTILEIGTGLGYQAALLGRLARKVYSVELIEELADQARARLKRLGFDNVVVRRGDGSRGWVEHAPFDKIMVTAAPELVPSALIHQLKPGGTMVIPAGIADAQELMVVEKSAEGRVRMRAVLAVRFSALVVDEV
ncbi:MAG: protein-L-isoaspartate(D-aspartate) O-methyltransferase [Alphaproteobacteria bacterium]|nr:protein-L-isoaspartate(D-aspartate) O-methyltransferase [Alphaproteobacteria bacterium]